MSKQFLQAELKKEGDLIEFIASDETLDRHGEKVPIDAWDLKNYKKNPVLLINHDYRVQNIVGKAKNLRVEGKKLIFEPVFHELTDLAKEVTGMVKDGFLNTVSVGFLPHWPETKGSNVINELLEISFVPVPANPMAQRIKDLSEEAASKEMNPEQEKKLKEFLETVEIIDQTPEAMEKAGWEIIRSIEQFKNREESKLPDNVKNILTLCETTFIEKLVEDAEKLKELNEPKETNKGRAEKDERNLRLLKLVAKQINQALYQAKRQ